MFTEAGLRMTYGLPSKLEVDQFIDLIQKGKAAPIGEIRTWSGQQYVKHADGWVHVHPVTGKVSVLPTSGPIKKLDGNDEHKAHFEKYIELAKEPGQKPSQEPSQELTNTLKPSVEASKEVQQTSTSQAYEEAMSNVVAKLFTTEPASVSQLNKILLDSDLVCEISQDRKTCQVRNTKTNGIVSQASTFKGLLAQIRIDLIKYSKFSESIEDILKIENQQERQNKLVPLVAIQTDPEILKSMSPNEIEQALKITKSLEVFKLNIPEFYQKIQEYAKTNPTASINSVLSLRFVIKHGISIVGNWSDKLNALKSIETLSDELPTGFIKNNNKIKSFSAQEIIDQDKSIYASYDFFNKQIFISNQLNSYFGVKGDIQSKNEMSAVFVHEIGHAVQYKLSSTTQGNTLYMKFANLCGWSNQEYYNYAGGNEEDIPRSIHQQRLITNYAQKSTKEAFSEYFSSYFLNKQLINKSLDNHVTGITIQYRNLPKLLSKNNMEIYKFMREKIFENDNLIKSVMNSELT